MYNYYTRYKETRERGIYKDLFLDINIKIDDNPDYEKARWLFHEHINNVLSVIKLSNGEKRYVKEYNGKTIKTDFTPDYKNEVIGFFNSRNLQPVLSKNIDKKNRFELVDIYEKDFKSTKYSYYSGYKRIRRDFFNEFIVKLYKNRLLFLKGEDGSGKTSFLLDLIEFLQLEGKLIFYFKTIEQLKNQILNFLFLGKSAPKDINLDSLLKSIDRENSFLFIDDYSDNFFISELISDFTKGRIIVSGTKELSELRQFKKISFPSFNFNEIKNIFFWAEEDKLLRIYNEFGGDIKSIKKELTKNYKIALTKIEEKFLIDIFLKEQIPSYLSSQSKDKLLKNHIIENQGDLYKISNYDYINKRLLINLIEKEEIKYDYNKIRFIFSILKNKEKIISFYYNIPNEYKIKFIDTIDLKIFPDKILRKLLQILPKDSGKENNYVIKILESIKRKTNEDKIKLIDEYIKSNDYKKALSYFSELDETDSELKLKKIKLLRLTGDISEAINDINEIMKSNILSESQKGFLQIEAGLSYYSLGNKEKAKKIFQKIIDSKVYGKNKSIKNKAVLYISYINEEEKKKNLDHLYRLYISYLKDNEFYELGEISSDIGQIYFKKFELDKALNWFNLSSYYFDKIGHKRAHTLGGFNKGEVLKNKGELGKAKELIGKAYEIDSDTGNSYSLSLDLLSLAEIALLEEKYDLSFNYLKEIKRISPNKAITKSFSLLFEVSELLTDGNKQNNKGDIFPKIIKNIDNAEYIRNTLKKYSDDPMEEIKSVIFISKGCSIYNKKLPTTILKYYSDLTEKNGLSFYNNIINSIIMGKNSKYSKYKAIETFLSEFYGESIKIGNNKISYSGKKLSENYKNDIEIIVQKLLNNKKIGQTENKPNIIGFDTTLRDIKEWADKIKNLPYSILIYGESGSGKELLAKYIHYTSVRSNKPFTSLNCAAIPSELLESILFGYKKGAFTGANDNSKGLIRETEGGTLFLDEIGELPLGMQAKLLRVIQEKEVIGIGENKPVKVDIRFVFATNRELSAEVEKESFREDLYYRVNELRVNLLPLRERKEDIPVLVKHFIEKHKLIIGKDNIRVSQEAMDILSEYVWRGNIRELETEVKRSLIRLKEGEYIISLRHLSSKLFETGSDKNRYKILPYKQAKERWEKNYILSIIGKEGNISKKKLAQKLGLSRMQLYNIMKKYDII